MPGPYRIDQLPGGRLAVLAGDKYPVQRGVGTTGYSQIEDLLAAFQVGGAAPLSVVGLTGLLATAQTPTAHAASHAPGGADAMAVDAAAATGSLRTLGPGAVQACSGTDPRLTDSRNPLAHAASHNAGGTDALAIDAAAITGSLRTLGTGAQQACAGADARLSNARLPTGAAGGDLSGTYPNPGVAKVGGLALGGGAPADGQVLTYVAADTAAEWKSAAAPAGVLVQAPALAAANTIQATADVVPLTVKRQAGSSSNLQDWISETGEKFTAVDNSGNIGSIAGFYAVPLIGSTGRAKMIPGGGGPGGQLIVSATGIYAWTNGADANASLDAALSRIGPGIIGAGNGSSADRSAWLVDAGPRRVSAQLDVTTSTALVNVPGLSVDINAGRTYSFEACLFVTPDAVGGAKYAIGGTATATAVIYEVTHVSDTGNSITVASRQTTLGGAAGAGGAGSGLCRIKGLITVNVPGTLAVQFAQNAANGTSSVLVGSDFIVLDNP